MSQQRQIFLKDQFCGIIHCYTVHYVTGYATKLRTVFITTELAIRVLIILQIVSLIKDLLTQRKKINHSDRRLVSL